MGQEEVIIHRSPQPAEEGMKKGGFMFEGIQGSTILSGAPKQIQSTVVRSAQERRARDTGGAELFIRPAAPPPTTITREDTRVTGIREPLKVTVEREERKPLEAFSSATITDWWFEPRNRRLEKQEQAKQVSKYQGEIFREKQKLKRAVSKVEEDGITEEEITLLKSQGYLVNFQDDNLIITSPRLEKAQLKLQAAQQRQAESINYLSQSGYSIREDQTKQFLGKIPPYNIIPDNILDSQVLDLSQTQQRMAGGIGISGISPLLFTEKGKSRIVRESISGPLTPLTKRESGFIEGYYTGFRDRPLLSTALFVGSAGFAGAIRGASPYVSELIKNSPRVIKGVSFAGKTLKYGLPAAYLGLTGYKVATAPTARSQGQVLGRAGQEITLFIGGARTGEYLANQYIRKPKVKFVSKAKAKEFLQTDKQSRFKIDGEVKARIIGTKKIQTFKFEGFQKTTRISSRDVRLNIAGSNKYSSGTIRLDDRLFKFKIKTNDAVGLANMLDKKGSFTLSESILDISGKGVSAAARSGGVSRTFITDSGKFTQSIESIALTKGGTKYDLFTSSGISKNIFEVTTPKGQTFKTFISISSSGTQVGKGAVIVEFMPSSTKFTTPFIKTIKTQTPTKDIFGLDKTGQLFPQEQTIKIDTKVKDIFSLTPEESPISTKFLEDVAAKLVTYPKTTPFVATGFGLGLLTGGKTQPRSITVQRPIQRAITKQAPTQKTFLSDMSLTTDILGSMQIASPITLTATRTSTATATRTLTTTTQPQREGSPFKFRLPIYTPTTTIIPEFDWNLKPVPTKKKKKGRRFWFGYGIPPSIYAIEYNITTPKDKELIKRYAFTGLGVRPVSTKARFL